MFSNEGSDFLEGLGNLSAIARPFVLDLAPRQTLPHEEVAAVGRRGHEFSIVDVDRVAAYIQLVQEGGGNLLQGRTLVGEPSERIQTPFLSEDFFGCI